MFSCFTVDLRVLWSDMIPFQRYQVSLSGFKNRNHTSRSIDGQRCLSKSCGLALLTLKAVMLVVSSNYWLWMRSVTWKKSPPWCSYFKPMEKRVHSVSDVLLLQLSLMALVNHTAIREKMNHWNKGNDLHSESLTREGSRLLFIQCAMTLWRSLFARVLNGVLKAWPYCYVSPLSFMINDTIDDDRNVAVYPLRRWSKSNM